MVVLDKRIDVHAPPKRVWELISRGPGLPGWFHEPGKDHGDTHLAPGRLIVSVRDDLGLRLTSEQETVAAEPERRFAWRQRVGDFRVNEGAIALASVNPGTTRVHLRATLELPFVLPRLLTEHEIRAHYSRTFDASLLDLKVHAEA